METKRKHKEKASINKSNDLKKMREADNIQKTKEKTKEKTKLAKDYLCVNTN